MSFFSRLLGQTPAATTPTAVSSVTPPPKPAAPASSLAPAFDVAKAPQQAQMKQAARESEFLGENFKACLMQVGVANTRGAPTFYGYGTHKPMEAWLTKVPADGKLSMNLIATPSTHAGSTEEECQKNFDTFAKTNVYNLEVVYPDGTRELKKFDVKGNSPPEFGSSKPSPTKQTASVSPEIVIDLAVWAGKGDIRIRG